MKTWLGTQQVDSCGHRYIVLCALPKQCQDSLEKMKAHVQKQVEKAEQVKQDGSPPQTAKASLYVQQGPDTS